MKPLNQTSARGESDLMKLFAELKALDPAVSKARVSGVRGFGVWGFTVFRVSGV